MSGQNLLALTRYLKLISAIALIIVCIPILFSCSTSIHVEGFDAKQEFLTFQPLPTPTPTPEAK